jgi:hypothetical protein
MDELRPVWCQFAPHGRGCASQVVRGGYRHGNVLIDDKGGVSG